MNSRKRRSVLIWCGLAFTWLIFFAWYSSFSGPLTEAEIVRYMALIEAGDRSEAEMEAIRHFLETDSGDDFVMLNIIEMRPQPQQVRGVTLEDSSADVLSRYMAYMWPALLRRACHPVMVGSAAAPALDVWGIDGAGPWSQAAFMRYRSRRDMLDIATDPAFQGPHEFKVAAMTRTIAFPADPWVSAGDPRLLLAMLLIIVGLLAGRTR